MNGLWESIFGFLGFGLKTRVDSIEKRHDDLGHSVRYADTCDKTHEGLDTRLTGIESMQKEMRDDIKELLRRKE